MYFLLPHKQPSYTQTLLSHQLSSHLLPLSSILWQRNHCFHFRFSDRFLPTRLMGRRMTVESEMTNNNGLTACTSLQMKSALCDLCPLFSWVVFLWLMALFRPNEATRRTRGRKIAAFSKHSRWINYMRQNKAYLTFSLACFLNLKNEKSY